MPVIIEWEEDPENSPKIYKKLPHSRTSDRRKPQEKDSDGVDNSGREPPLSSPISTVSKIVSDKHENNSEIQKVNEESAKNETHQAKLRHDLRREEDEHDKDKEKGEEGSQGGGEGGGAEEREEGQREREDLSNGIGEHKPQFHSFPHQETSSASPIDDERIYSEPPDESEIVTTPVKEQDQAKKRSKKKTVFGKSKKSKKGRDDLSIDSQSTLPQINGSGLPAVSNSHLKDTDWTEEDNYAVVKEILTEEEFDDIPMMRLRFRPLYAYLICGFETIFLLICAALNGLHFGMAFANIPLLNRGPTIFIIAVTGIQILLGLAFEVFLFCGIYHRKRRFVRMHRYGQTAAIPILILNGSFVLGACFLGSFNESLIYGEYKPVLIIFLAIFSLVVAMVEGVFICCLRPLARRSKRLRSKSKLYVAMDKESLLADPKATISTDSFLVANFPPPNVPQANGQKNGYQTKIEIDPNVRRSPPSIAVSRRNIITASPEPDLKSSSDESISNIGENKTKDQSRSSPSGQETPSHESDKDTLKKDDNSPKGLSVSKDNLNSRRLSGTTGTLSSVGSGTGDVRSLVLSSDSGTGTVTPSMASPTSPITSNSEYTGDEEQQLAYGLGEAESGSVMAISAYKSVIRRDRPLSVGSSNGGNDSKRTSLGSMAAQLDGSSTGLNLSSDGDNTLSKKLSTESKSSGHNTSGSVTKSPDTNSKSTETSISRSSSNRPATTRFRSTEFGLDSTIPEYSGSTPTIPENSGSTPTILENSGSTPTIPENSGSTPTVHSPVEDRFPPTGGQSRVWAQNRRNLKSNLSGKQGFQPRIQRRAMSEISSADVQKLNSQLYPANGYNRNGISELDKTATLPSNSKSSHLAISRFGSLLGNL